MKLWNIYASHTYITHIHIYMCVYIYYTIVGKEVKVDFRTSIQPWAQPWATGPPSACPAPGPPDGFPVSSSSLLSLGDRDCFELWQEHRACH